MRPTPPGPSRIAVILVRTIPIRTFITCDPPISTEDFRICPYVSLRGAAAAGVGAVAGISEAVDDMRGKMFRDQPNASCFAVLPDFAGVAVAFDEKRIGSSGRNWFSAINAAAAASPCAAAHWHRMENRPLRNPCNSTR